MDLKPLAHPTLVVVAAVFGLLLALSEAAGVLGLPLLILLRLAGIRYGYTLLRAVAQGRRHLPVPDVESMNPVGEFAVVLHSLFFSLLAVLLVNSSLLGSGAGIEAVRIAGVLALAAAYPASAAMLALTGELGAAFSPRAVTSLVTLLGRRYWLLLAGCAAVLVAYAAVVRLPMPRLLAMPLDHALTVWAGLAVFALIGSELRAHRHLLDIPGEREPEAERRERERPIAWQQILDRAYGSIRSGLTAQGYGTIRELLESEGRSLPVQQWVFERMLTWEDKTHALRFAAGLVAALLAQGQQYDALELVTRCRRVSPSFALSREVSLSIAAFARSIGRDGIADELTETAERAPS